MARGGRAAAGAETLSIPQRPYCASEAYGQFSLAPESRQLHVNVKFEDARMPRSLALKRVYDAISPRSHDRGAGRLSEPAQGDNSAHQLNGR